MNTICLTYNNTMGLIVCEFRNKAMTFGLFLGILLLLIQPAVAQKLTPEDSLRKLLQKDLPDSSNVIILNELAWVLKGKNLKEALIYAQKGKNLAEEIGYLPGMATSYNRIGLIKQYRGNWDVALSYYRKALQIEQKIGHQYGIARAQNQIGAVYHKRNKITSAIEYYEKAHQILHRLPGLKAAKAIAETKNNLGFCYKDMGDNTKAMKYYLEALKIREDIGEARGLADSYLRLGYIHSDNKNYEKSLRYYQDALKIFDNLSDKYELAKVYYSMGWVYMNLRDYPKALQYYEKSLDYQQDLGANNLMAKLFKNIGYVFVYQNKNKEALDYYEKSMDLSIKQQDTLGIAMVYGLMGELMLRQKKYTQSIDYYLENLLLIQKSGKKIMELDALKNVSVVYAEMGDYKNSHEYNKKYVQLRDSLENTYRASINFKEAYKEKKHQYDLLTGQQERERERFFYKSQQKTLLIYMLMVGTGLLGLVFWFILKTYRTRQKILLTEKKLQNKEREVENILKGQELKTMGAMLEGQEIERRRIAQDLHDRLGSLLAVIKLNFQAVDQQIDELKAQNKEQYLQAHKLLDEASDEVRKIAHNMVSGVLRKFGLLPALEGLKDAITNTKLLKVNLVDVGFDNNRRLDYKIEIAVYRIIQELVSNVLRHAEAEKLEIQVFWKKEGLNIIVEDDGIGFDVEETEQKSGIGLKGIQSRIDNLRGELSIDSQIGKRTTFIIDIPL